MDACGANGKDTQPATSFLNDPSLNRLQRANLGGNLTPVTLFQHARRAISASICCLGNNQTTLR